MASVPANFTHLEVHSHYTLLGGTASVQDLVQRAAADGLHALALADTNVLYGAVAFDRACRAAGLQPLIGMTLSLAAPPEELPVDRSMPGQVVLLAQNAAGYRSLCQLASLLQSSPRRRHWQQHGLDWSLLKAHRQGLICLTGGQKGWIDRLLRAGQPVAAARVASRLGALFEDRCYVSLSPAWAEDALAGETLQIGERFGLRPVALQPVYALAAEDLPCLRLLAAIRDNCRLEEVALPATASGAAAPPLHWPALDEFAAAYAARPDFLANVDTIVSRCKAVLPDGRPIWPALDLPGEKTAAEALGDAARTGIKAKYGKKPPAAVGERLAHELAVIEEYGFAPLFLLVADITRFAREADVPVSTRGSVANSLVAYAIGITDVDPVAHELLFERFLNPARATLPDIDLDFCSRRRDLVLDYLRRTYGADRLALVATFSTLQPKSAVRETGKAYGLSEERLKALAGRLPRGWHPDPARRAAHDVEAVVAGIEDPTEREVVSAAYGIIGQPHHLSIHPGGVVITPGPLTDIVPLQMAPKGFLITQFDHKDVEAIGLPKIDLLGIRALTVLADTAEAVRARRDPAFRLAEIPAADEKTAAMLSRGETVGVFQCESNGAQRTLRQLQVRDVGDLAVANAFFKPGPATGGMARAFIRRYRGDEPVTFLHPSLEPILGSTMGVLLFQEQVLRIAREIAGLSWQAADQLRRGMSKFQAQRMAALATRFVLGCQRPAPEGPGLTREQAETLWEQVLAFAGYGFNKGHATAYATVSYRSAYLKAHYPAEFLCARLAGHGGFHHPAIYIAEARRLGIPVYPPHVNISSRRFTLAGDAAGEHGLWMGLGAVRSLRRSSVDAIVAERERAPFADLRDLLGRVTLQKKEVANLIRCGAGDGLGDNRAALLAEAGEVQRAGSAQQMAFSFALREEIAPETLAERLAWEMRVLGMPVSVNPLDLVAGDSGSMPLRKVPHRPNKPATLLGVRLPGWTGGKGFFLGDGDSYLIVRADGAAGDGATARKPWRPLRISGHWRRDEWGGGWFQAEAVENLLPDLF